MNFLCTQEMKMFIVSNFSAMLRDDVVPRCIYNVCFTWDAYIMWKTEIIIGHAPMFLK